MNNYCIDYYSSEIDPEITNITTEQLMKRIKYSAAFTNSINKFDINELPLLQEILLVNQLWSITLIRWLKNRIFFKNNRFDVQLTMKKLVLPCHRLLYRCRFENVVVDCKHIFSLSETYQGYCCSFNIQKPHSSSSVGKTEHIRKTQHFGPQMGLSVILNPLIEKNAMTSVNSEGIKILLNEFNLYPSTRTIERMLPHRQETYVEVRPERTDCSDAVESLPISDRGCVFKNEHQLR